MHCAACSHLNREGAKFCDTCGASLSAPSPELISAAASSAPVGERRQLTVLVCDLVGSTALSEQLETEEWSDIIAQYQSTVSAAVARYGGHVAQYVGDGVLVYFGWPTAHEDDPQRGVHAGLAILDAMVALNAALATRVAVRVGVHTGPVVMGQIGGRGKSEVLASGDMTNIAVCAQGAAEPDTVVITAATQRLTSGLFVVEDRGPQELKDVREPVTLYRVVRPSGVRSRLDVTAGHLTCFVGRETELGTLIDRCERAEDGEGHAVVVLGEPGVGKSRLVYQLREHLAAVPHRWLECGATPYTEGTPFHPIIALVAQGLGFASDDSTAKKLDKIERALGVLASAETTALLADFLGLPAPTKLQLSAGLQRRKTIDLVVQWILSLAAAQPLVVCVEDLHWCDVSTLELLGHLIAQSPTVRVLLIATSRLEFTVPWAARSNLATVQLARLTRRQAREMVMTLAGPALPAATVDALVARADGVPLHVEELTKGMTEPGAASGADAIPASLADSLMARLDRLSTAKEVAQRAAVLGREFEYPLLEAMVDMDELALRQALEGLVAAEIVYARGEPPAATYTFKHALIQETAYQSLLKRTRQQLHARVAQALDERFAERVAAEPEVLARHYEQAGLATQAIAHYQRAGKRATQRSANEEAIAYLRRALDLVATLPETRERHQMELALQMTIAAPLGAARRFSHPEYEQTYRRGRELASLIGESPELPRVLVGMAGAYLLKGDLANGGEVAQLSLAAAERRGDVFDLLSAHYEVGQSFFYAGDFSRALKHFEQTIERYNPGEHGSLAHAVGVDRGVTAHAYAAWCYLYRGYPDRALALSEVTVALAKRVEHPLSLAIALFFAGVLHFQRGDLDSMRERAEETVALSEYVGIPWYVGMGRVLRGLFRIEAGHGEAGVEEMQQAWGELAEIGSGVAAPQVLCVLADGYRKVERHDDAAGVLALAVAQVERLGTHFYDAELSRLRAETLLDTDCDAVTEEAEAFLGRSLEIARRQEAKTFELRAATSLARLWRRQGKHNAARALAGPLCAWFTEGFSTRDLREAKALLDDLY